MKNKRIDTNDTLVNKRVFNYSKICIGMVIEEYLYTFRVKHKWFGSLREKKMLSYADIDLVGHNGVFMHPTQDEYWQSPAA